MVRLSNNSWCQSQSEVFYKEISFNILLMLIVFEQTTPAVCQIHVCAHRLNAECCTYSDPFSRTQKQNLHFLQQETLQD